MRRIILCILLLACMECIARPDTILMRLDRIIEKRDDFEKAKRASIEEHKANYRSSLTPEDKYNSLRGLYTEYSSYKIDSAMIAADERLTVARKIGNKSKIASATLNLAEAYVKSGASDKGISILDTLDTGSLEKYHYKYRLGIYRNAYSAKVEMAVSPKDKIEALDRLNYFTEQAISQSPAGSLGSFTLEAEKLGNAGLHVEAVAKIEEAAENYDLSNDAAMQYTLGEMYLNANMREKAKDALARSAIIDLSNGVREYRALILLSRILFEDGEIERAFNYINCAFDDSEFSHSYLRTSEIMRSMPAIDAAFHVAERQINRRTNILLIVTVALVVLLIISLILVVREFSIKKKMLATIATINARLEEKNRELKEADSLKQAHINALMLAYAAHISNLRDFRKSVYRLLKTSQLESAMNLVKSDKIESLDIAEFHEMFDKLFLSMYPGFVEDMNRFMESPYKIKEPGRLIPELRIAAMIRLGMTSTEEIAGLLHYSNQTVYNLRSSLKGRLKGDWDEFETYLKQI